MRTKVQKYNVQNSYAHAPICWKVYVHRGPMGQIQISLIRISFMLTEKKNGDCLFPMGV